MHQIYKKCTYPQMSAPYRLNNRCVKILFLHFYVVLMGDIYLVGILIAESHGKKMSAGLTVLTLLGPKSIL